MQKDFVIDNDIAFKGDNYYLDIHNCYNLVAFEIYNKEGVLTMNLCFEKAEECILDGHPFNFKLSFFNITYFSGQRFFTERIIDIDRIGYKRIDDNDLSWLLEEKHFDKDCCLVFLFDDDVYLKILCEKIELLEVE